MRKCLSILAVVLVVVAGCQKLNYEKTVEVPTAGTFEIEFSEPAYAQAVEVSISPDSEPVSAYIVKKSDLETARGKCAPGKAPPADLVLDGKTFKETDSRQDFTLKATIPAKTAYAVLLSGGKKTNVKVKVLGGWAGIV